MPRVIAALMLALLLSTRLALVAIDAAGEWEVTFTGPQGPAEYRWTLSRKARG